MRNKLRNALRGMVALSATPVVLAAAPARAQTAPSAAADAGAPANDDIIITARRKEERLLDVPINVTALTGESLKELGVQSYAELMNAVPSLNTIANDRGDTVKLTMRGLGVSTIGGPKATVFLDGVYIAGNYSGMPLDGLGTIEVLKGPQSALFGRSTFAGAINYVTRTPGDEFKGSLNAEVATLGETRVDGYLSGALAPGVLRFVLSGTYDKYQAPDAWVNPTNGIRNGAQHGGGAMGKLIFTPTDSLTVTGVASYTRIDDAPLAALFINPAARDRVFNKINPATGATTAATGRYPSRIVSVTPRLGNFDATYQYVVQPGYEADVLTSYLRAEWQSASGFSATLTGGYGRESAHNGQNISLRNRAPAGGGYAFSLDTQLEEKDKSVELRLATSEDRPIRFSAGAYYLDLTRKYDPNRSDSYLLAPVVGTFDLIIPHFYANTRTKSRSIFGAAYIDLSRNLTLSLEGRYQSEKVDTVSADSVTTLRSFYNPAAPYTLNNRAFGATFKAFLPRVNLQYKISDQFNVYATYSEGTTPGGFNTAIFTPPEFRTIKEENLRNYEIGVKGRLTPTLTIEAAAYHMDWLDQQTTGTFYINNVNVALTTNQGNSRVNGGEALVTWDTPLTGLKLRAAASYNDATYKNFCSVNYAALTYDYTGIPTAQRAQYACRDVGGNKLEAISPFQATLSFDYGVRLGAAAEGYLRGDYDYFSPMWDSEFNLAKTEAANVLNLRAGVTVHGWTIEVYGKNITQENAPVRIQRASDIYAGADNTTNQSVTLVLRRPRQLGLRVGYRF